MTTASIAKALKGLNALQNVAGFFLVFAVVPATAQVLPGGGTVEALARGYFLSVFFLVCLEIIFYLRAPNTLGAALSLLIPNYAFLAFAWWRHGDLWPVVRDGAFVYLAPMVLAWAAAFPFALVQNLRFNRSPQDRAVAATVLPLCFLIFVVPAASALYLYGTEYVVGQNPTAVLATAATVLIGVIAHARLAVGGVVHG